jgi:hypothetical protein
MTDLTWPGHRRCSRVRLAIVAAAEILLTRGAGPGKATARTAARRAAAYVSLAVGGT